MKDDHIEFKLQKIAITWGGNIQLSSTVLSPHIMDGKIHQLSTGTTMLDNDRQRKSSIKINGNRFSIIYETIDGNTELKNEIDIMIDDAEWLCEKILIMIAQENRNKLL